MKKGLLGLLLLMIMGGMSTANASDTSCWSEYGGTPPVTTYASGIVYGCDDISVPGKSIPIITIYGENRIGSGVGITIKAMNEGTGTVEIGTGEKSYGSYYQWGNNFPFSGTITLLGTYTNASGYGPNTEKGYYNSGVRMTGVLWDSSDNRNLWGGSGDEKNLNGLWGFDTVRFTVTNPGDRQAMCPEGYHIPSRGEWNALFYLWTKNSDYYVIDLDGLLGGLGNDSKGTRFGQDMMLPFQGNRKQIDANLEHVELIARYWSSSPDDRYSENARNVLNTKDALLRFTERKGVGMSVRCFKNSYVPRPKILNLVFMSDGEEVGTGEVTENMTGVVPEKVTNKIVEMMKTGYVLEYRYLSGSDASAGFSFENESITGGMANESGNVYFIAQWTGI